MPVSRTCLLYKSETSAQDSIDSFSRLLGAMLYGDMRMHKDTEEVWKKDAAPVTVSYTHLDVYKRQDYRGWVQV